MNNFRKFHLDPDPHLHLTQYRRISLDKFANYPKFDDEYLKELELMCEYPILDASNFENEITNVLRLVEEIHHINGYKEDALNIFKKLISYPRFKKSLIKDLCTPQSPMISVHNICDFILQKQFKISSKEFKFHIKFITWTFWKNQDLGEISPEKIFGDQVELPLQTIIDQGIFNFPIEKKPMIFGEPAQMAKQKFGVFGQRFDQKAEESVDVEESLNKITHDRILTDDFLQEMNGDENHNGPHGYEGPEEEETKANIKKGESLIEQMFDSDEEVKHKEEDVESSLQPKLNPNKCFEDELKDANSNGDKHKLTPNKCFEDKFERKSNNHDSLNFDDHDALDNVREIELDARFKNIEEISTNNKNQKFLNIGENFLEKTSRLDSSKQKVVNDLTEIKRKIGDDQSLLYCPNEVSQKEESIAAKFYYLVDFIIPKDKMISKSVRNFEILMGTVSLRCDYCTFSRLDIPIKKTKIKGIMEAKHMCKYCSKQNDNSIKDPSGSKTSECLSKYDLKSSFKITIIPKKKSTEDMSFCKVLSKNSYFWYSELYEGKKMKKPKIEKDPKTGRPKKKPVLNLKNHEDLQELFQGITFRLTCDCGEKYEQKGLPYRDEFSFQKQCDKCWNSILFQINELIAKPLDPNEYDPVTKTVARDRFFV